MSWIEDWFKKEHDKDKCGAYIFATKSDSVFTPACRIHDLEYVKNETGEQNKTRLQIDKEFLQNLLVIANEHSGVRKTYLVTRAYMYYGLVRVFGGLVW